MRALKDREKFNGCRGSWSNVSKGKIMGRVSRLKNSWYWANTGCGSELSL